MFSVVIPLYNKSHTITRTLSSVLAQTYAEYEVVIIDDGSTDNGVEIIEKFTNDPRVRIVSQTNRGVSAARNKGVLESKGAYIAFLDGDDEWLPGYLEKITEAIKLFPDAGMFCCAGIVRDSRGDHLRQANKYQDKICEINYFENPHVFTHTSATVVEKVSFNNSKGFPEGMKRNQDFALFFSLALHVRTVYCGFPLSIYVGDVDGQATSTPLHKVLPHVVNRFNYVHKNSLLLPKNVTYHIFTKYELRHHFCNLIRKNSYGLIDFMLENLSDNLLTLFSDWELGLLKNKRLKPVSCFYLNITKTLWRLRGFPRVH